MFMLAVTLDAPVMGTLHSFSIGPVLIRVESRIDDNAQVIYQYDG